MKWSNINVSLPSMSRFLLLVLLALPLLVSSLEICEQCRPIALQETPGIGISLGFDHITAAVQLHNGALIHGVHTNASDEYIHAMTRLHELISPRTSFRVEVQDEAVLSPQLPLSTLRPIPIYDAGQQLERAMAPYLDILDKTGRSVIEQTIKEYNLPDSHIYIALPDAIVQNVIDKEYLTSFLPHSAGSTTFEGPHRQSESDLRELIRPWMRCRPDEGEHMHTILGPDICHFEYQGHRIKRTLSIELSDRYFAMNWINLGRNFVGSDISRTRSYLNQGIPVTGLPENSHYWIWLEERLREFVTNNDKVIDLITVRGSQAMDTSFQRILRNVFKNNLDALMPARETSSHTFGVARHSAKTAKYSTWMSHQACLYPENCPVSRYMPEELRCWWIAADDWRQFEDTQRFTSNETWYP